ncbi:MAG: putative Ig domain-containing protein [Syntrophobacterales bacterium]|nr:putative Ig domain-containing protein [Syntrophobacterales bacterium]
MKKFLVLLLMGLFFCPAVAQATKPTIIYSSIPPDDGTVGVYYSYLLNASGTAPISWSVVGGNLPPGLKLTGPAISGTPTTAGVFSFTVTASNYEGSDSKQMNISISSYKSPVITTSSLPECAQGKACSYTLKATGSEPISWFVSSGGLPPGLSLNQGTGVISGTPMAVGTFNFMIEARNKEGSDQKLLSARIVYTPSLSSAGFLPRGCVGESYLGKLFMNGGDNGATPRSWLISSGSLPPGLTLNHGTGVISGTPTAGYISDFTAKVITDVGDATESCRIYIDVPEPPIIDPSYACQHSDCVVGRNYSCTLRVSNWSLPAISWSVAGGALPPGLSLASSGEISGTPTAAGTFNFTVKAENRVGSGTMTMSITATALPKITTSSLPEGKGGEAYSHTLAASGTPPISWSVVREVVRDGGYVSGGIPLTIRVELPGLPSGLRLDTNTGVISGIPTELGSFVVTIEARNNTGSDQKTLTIVIQGDPALIRLDLPSGTVGQYYEYVLNRRGTLIWSAAHLPPGLSLAGNGDIYGVPREAGFFVISLYGQGQGTRIDKELGITIMDPFNITTSSLPGGTVGVAYSQSLSASGAAPISWSVAGGALPPGLSLASSGEISGTPTAAGTFNFTVKAQNNVRSDTKDMSISIMGIVPMITTSSLPVGTVGVAYSQSLSASGIAPISWSVAGGALPPGLSLASSGEISGTPTAAGTFNFTVKAQNRVGSDTKDMSINIVTLNRSIIDSSKIDNMTPVPVGPIPIDSKLKNININLEKIVVPTSPIIDNNQKNIAPTPMDDNLKKIAPTPTIIAPAVIDNNQKKMAPTPTITTPAAGVP